MKSPLRLGIAGLGTVGSGVVRMLCAHGQRLAETVGRPILVTGVSARMQSAELARRVGLAWESLPNPKHPFSLEVISPDRDVAFVNLGPHPPRLWPEDVDLLHEIWLKLSSSDKIGSRLHHRDIVGAALRRLSEDLDGEGREALVAQLENSMAKEPKNSGPDTSI